MIRIRIGLIGGGKTMLTARDALEDCARRSAVFASNIWTAGSLPYPEWLKVRDGDRMAAWRVQLSTGRDGFDLDELDDVIEWVRSCDRCTRLDHRGQVGHGEPGCTKRGVVLLLDEVGVLIPARMWQKFGVDLMQTVSQSRKNRVDVWMTAQDIEDVDAYVRKKAYGVWKVRCWPTGSIERQEKGKRPWFFFESHWSPGAVGKRDRRRGWRFRRYRRSDELEYDTDEIVRPARRLTEGDLCRRHKAEAIEAACPMCHPPTPIVIAEDDSPVVQEVVSVPARPSLLARTGF
jgi:hypothetical protein